MKYQLDKIIDHCPTIHKCNDTSATLSKADIEQHIQLTDRQWRITRGMCSDATDAEIEEVEELHRQQIYAGVSKMKRQIQ